MSRSAMTRGRARRRIAARFDLINVTQASRSVQADVTSGGDSFVAALGNLSGPVQATGDAGLFAGGTLDADITGAYDATLESIGDMTGTAAPSHNLSAASYGNLNPTNFQAGQNMTLLWARGDMTGTVSAVGTIVKVESYGSINASLTAPNIGLVEAFGPIGGTFTASTAIGSVASGGDITATLDSPSVGSTAPYQHGLLTDWPQTPVISDTLELELRDEDRQALESLAAQLAAEKAAALAQLPADIAAATPTFKVSIGDLAMAVAWFQNEAIQLAAQIANMQAGDQRSLTAAQTSLNTYFAAEDARLALAKSGNQVFFTTVSNWLTQVVADRMSDAAGDKADALVILTAARKEHTAILSKLDTQRDLVWPIMFEKQLLTLMLDRIQLVLDIVGIIDPTPISDGVNALISLARGNLLDAGISAISILPYVGDLAKAGKLGKLGKFADDGLAAMRRVTGDFLNLAARGAGYANSCQAAAAFGAGGRAAQKLGIVGCFVGGTDVGGFVRRALGEPIIVQPETAELDEGGVSHRNLFICIMVTTAAGGWWLANRRLYKKDEREKQKRAAIKALFDSDADDDFALHDIDADLLAHASQLMAPEDSAFSAHDEAMSDLMSGNDGKVAGIVRMPSHCGTSVGDSSPALPRTRSALAGRKERVSTMDQGNTPKRAKPRTTAHRRQSRFGLFWLISFLSIAALAFFFWPAAPAKRAAPILAIAAPSAEEPQYELRMKPIEEYRLGERFIAINPLGAEDEPEPDPATWKSVKMRLRKASGKYLTMELLLSREKMLAYRIGRSPTVEIDLPEMGISGAAEVLAINSCPEIEPGEGSVVTGTFMQESEGNLFNLFFEGDAEPLGVTDNHPFLSLDRGEYVTTGELRRGELLSSGYDGVIARVARIEHRPADEMVYNLQVNGHHVYHVGPLAVLVHNVCEHHSIPKFLGGLAGQPTTTLSKNVHVEYHQLLSANLRRAGLPPMGGRTGSTKVWKSLMKQNAGTQRRAFDAVLDAARAIDAKYGTNIVQDFWSNTMTKQFTPFP